MGMRGGGLKAGAGRSRSAGGASPALHVADCAEELGGDAVEADGAEGGEAHDFFFAGVEEFDDCGFGGVGAEEVEEGGDGGVVGCVSVGVGFDGGGVPVWAKDRADAGL